jgi:putative transposase
MQRLLAFKYELMPNGEQQRAMRRFAGSCRFVFNKALALQQASMLKAKRKRHGVLQSRQMVRLNSNRT